MITLISCCTIKVDTSLTRQTWSIVDKDFQQFLTSFSHFIDSVIDYQTFEPSEGFVKEPSKVNF